jgi:hypothetical protein
VSVLIQANFIIVLAVTAFAGREAIRAIIARDVLCIVVFGFIAILALIYVVLALLGIH